MEPVRKRSDLNQGWIFVGPSGGASGLMCRTCGTPSTGGMAVTIMDSTDGLLAGTELWDSTVTMIHTAKLSQLSSDPTIVEAMRGASHRILYSVANSNAMNGWGPNGRLVDITPWWKTALLIINVALGALALGAAYMTYRMVKRDGLVIPRKAWETSRFMGGPARCRAAPPLRRRAKEKACHGRGRLRLRGLPHGQLRARRHRDALLVCRQARELAVGDRGRRGGDGDGMKPIQAVNIERKRAIEAGMPLGEAMLRFRTAEDLEREGRLPAALAASDAGDDHKR